MSALHYFAEMIQSHLAHSSHSPRENISRVASPLRRVHSLHVFLNFCDVNLIKVMFGDHRVLEALTFKFLFYFWCEDLP